MKAEQDQFRECNHFGCNSLHRLLPLFDDLEPSTASAKIPEHLDKAQNTSDTSFLKQNSCINSTEYQIYLCDYIYQERTWSIDIHATSFEDANHRLKALTKGEIIGELKLRIPIPIKQGWVERLKNWLRNF